MTAAPPQHPLTALAPSMRLPVTICVLAYGNQARLAKRFLESLYQHTEPALFFLRAGLNEAEAETHRLIQHYAAQFGNVTVVAEEKNIFKSPMMRRLFHHPPIETAWTIWCDDDTHFTRSDWLQRLAVQIEGNPSASLWGMHHALWTRDRAVLAWIEKAPWFQGLPFCKGIDLDGKLATEFRFATGGFWAVRTGLLTELDWPDRRLVQANDDFLLGEALRQNRVKTGDFCYGIKINDAPRRNAKATQVHRLPA